MHALTHVTLSFPIFFHLFSLCAFLLVSCFLMCGLLSLPCQMFCLIPLLRLLLPFVRRPGFSWSCHPAYPSVCFLNDIAF